MGKVARQGVEQAGVDVNVLVDKLIRAAGAEFTTFYYYTILRVNSIGFDGEGLKEIIEDARIEDRNHFEALTPHIYELGGALPRDIRQFADIAGVPGTLPSAESARHEADVERAGGSGALRHPDVHRDLQFDIWKRPSDLRYC